MLVDNDEFQTRFDKQLSKRFSMINICCYDRQQLYLDPFHAITCTLKVDINNFNY